MTTDIEPYAAGHVEQYQARLVMTSDDAKALDDQLRAATKAVLREGTDYGNIPGTGGEQSLWRPGAQKLLQWFGLGFTCDRVEIDADEDGSRQGVTYRATVARRLADGSLVTLATCEGYAGYDESKFYQSAEQVQRKAEEAERRFAEKDRRPPRPTRWQGLPEYRAPWNTVIKRAQKRAIVGATIDATAAGGIFSQEREEDDHVHAAQDEGPDWYEQALEAALTFTTVERGQAGLLAAATAARDGLCTPGQATHIQNRIRQRLQRLQTASPVDVEDLGRPAHNATAGNPVDDGSDTEALGVDGKDEPGSASNAQLTKLHTIMTGLGFGAQDRDQKLTIAETITGHAPLTGPWEGRSSKNLSLTEARQLIDTLHGMDRDALVALMAERQAGDEDG
jgi:hypothetical protein